MPALSITLADELVTLLGTFSLGTCNIARRYLPLQNLSGFDDATTEITVMPADDTRQTARTETARTFTIDVALQRKLPDIVPGNEAADTAAADALLALADSLAGLLENAQFEAAFAKVTQVRTLLWEPRHMAELRLVTSLVKLTLEGQS